MCKRYKLKFVGTGWSANYTWTGCAYINGWQRSFDFGHTLRKIIGCSLVPMHGAECGRLYCDQSAAFRGNTERSSPRTKTPELTPTDESHRTRVSFYTICSFKIESISSVSIVIVRYRSYDCNLNKNTLRFTRAEGTKMVGLFIILSLINSNKILSNKTYWNTSMRYNIFYNV